MACYQYILGNSNNILGDEEQCGKVQRLEVMDDNIISSSNRNFLFQILMVVFFCFLWVFSTQWKTMLVFIHANGLFGINMLFEINKCPGSLGFIKVRQTFKVHWEERKGKELQPHNCAQVFPLIFCSCKLPELKVHWNFKIDINLLKYQSKDMRFWPLLWTHSFKACF